jgi:hypothetical protein
MLTNTRLHNICTVMAKEKWPARYNNKSQSSIPVLKISWLIRSLGQQSKMSYHESKMTSSSIYQLLSLIYWLYNSHFHSLQNLYKVSPSHNLEYKLSNNVDKVTTIEDTNQTVLIIIHITRYSRTQYIPQEVQCYFASLHERTAYGIYQRISLKHGAKRYFGVMYDLSVQYRRDKKMRCMKLTVDPMLTTSLTIHKRLNILTP